MEESLAFLQPITTALLGIGGICALLALIAAIIRYFFYQHDEQHTRPIKARVVHVFGMIAAFGLITGGVPKLVEQLTQNSTSQQILNESGSSMLPDSIAGKETYKFSNLGEAMENLSNGEDPSTDQVERAIESTTGENSAWQKDENGEDTFDIGKALSNAFILSTSSGVGALP